MNSISDPLLTLWSKTEKQYKFGFFTALLTGFITHYYMLSNKITNWDDEMCPPGVGGGEWFGRWLEYDINKLFNKWSVPSINGVAALILLAAAVCIIISVLSVRTVTGAILTAMVIMTFPSVASNLYYMYTVAGYSVSILLACAAVWITRRFRFGCIAGIIMLMLSMAIYQAYLPLAAAIFVILVIQDALHEKDIRRMILNAVVYVLTLLASVAAYLLSIRISGYELVDYKGMDNIGSAGLGSYLLAVLRAYHRVLQFFVTEPESYVSSAALLTSRLSILFLIILIVAVYLRYSSTMTSAFSHVAYWAGIFILPLAVALVYVMTPETVHASTVMTFPYVAVYLFMIVLFENFAGNSSENTDISDNDQAKKKAAFGKERGQVSRCLSLLLILLIFSTSYGNYKVNNHAYYRTWLAQQRMIQLSSRIMVHLENQEGYRYGQTVYILGEWGDYGSDKIIGMGQELFSDMEGAAIDSSIYMDVNRNRFIATYLGLPTGNLYGQDMDILFSFKDTDTYDAMPIFPAEGSILNTGDFWVVRIGE